VWTMSNEKEEKTEVCTHKVIFELGVVADNMDEALTKARDDVAKFRCHRVEIEVY